MKNNIKVTEVLSAEYITLDIIGRIFYVDFHLKMLRPKDDESSKGIPFKVFTDHFNTETNRCEIPYNKKNHEFVEIDYLTITEIPADVVVVAFPHLRILNPQEYSVMVGRSKKDLQDEIPTQKHFTATTLKGEGDWLEFLVVVNKQELPALKAASNP